MNQLIHLAVHSSSNLYNLQQYSSAQCPILTPVDKKNLSLDSKFNCLYHVISYHIIYHITGISYHITSYVRHPSMDRPAPAYLRRAHSITQDSNFISPLSGFTAIFFWVKVGHSPLFLSQSKNKSLCCKFSQFSPYACRSKCQ